MFKFFKGKSNTESPSKPSSTDSHGTTEETGFFAKLKASLRKTGNQLTSKLGHLFLGQKTIDDDLLEELETILLTADVGIEATQAIMDDLTQRVKRKDLKDTEALSQALQSQLYEMLKGSQAPLKVDGFTPFVLLVVGVNGAGKTTTIGKLAKLYQQQGKKVMLAAGDTFRAAAIEQLKIWGERNEIPVIHQHAGADSASVIFDAFESAKAKGYDLLIADTAGRLHTQDHLMEELKKVVRVLKKRDPEAPHEVMLVLDAGIGQNALVQAQKFHSAVGLNSLTITKLDGTAKGGILFAIAKTLKLPIRFIGIGEGIDDLKPFDAKAFVTALFEQGEIHADAESSD